MQLPYQTYSFEDVNRAIHENTLGQLVWNAAGDGRGYGIHVRMENPALDLVVQADRADGSGGFRAFPASLWTAAHPQHDRAMALIAAVRTEFARVDAAVKSGGEELDASINAVPLAGPLRERIGYDAQSVQAMQRRMAGSVAIAHEHAATLTRLAERTQQFEPALGEPAHRLADQLRKTAKLATRCENEGEQYGAQCTALRGTLAQLQAKLGDTPDDTLKNTVEKEAAEAMRPWYALNDATDGHGNALAEQQAEIYKALDHLRDTVDTQNRINPLQKAVEDALNEARTQRQSGTVGLAAQLAAVAGMKANKHRSGESHEARIIRRGDSTPALP